MNRKGFTLVELLAVIVILGVLAVIIVPRINNAIENSRKNAAATSASEYSKAITQYFLNSEADISKTSLDMNGRFVVDNGSLVKGSDSFKISVSGEAPKGGSVFLVNGEVVSGCLLIDKYSVIISDSVVSDVSNDCPPPSFANDSWEEIKANLVEDRSVYPIGSEKIIEFDRDDDGINEYYKLRLVNTAACGDYTGSRTSCGVVIEFVTQIGTHNMNSTETSAGGWKESAMRAFLNTDFGNIFSKLPSDLRNVIIGTVPIVSGSGSGEVSDNVVASGDFTGDKLYLLSTKEIGFNLSFDNKRADTDTRTLGYYVGTSEIGADAKRIKYENTSSLGVDGTVSLYWLRSASSYDTGIFCGGYYDGSTKVFLAHEDDIGVAPAFRILD